MENTDLLVFILVVAGRFFLPLLILRFPFPGIIIALVLDAIDQTIFQQFTSLNLDGYQGYDKALDVYYLTIAYISTLRNWEDHFAFGMSRFLYYYRIIGVTMFELTHFRPLLIIFPNTFEYFFIYIETIRLRWNPVRLTKKHVVLATAAIWIIIKLPQEYWIHIAQMDATDFLKEKLFNVPVSAGPSEILSSSPWIIPVLLGLVAAIILGTRWLLKKLPPADWAMTFDVDKHLKMPKELKTTKIQKVSEWLLTPALIEKIVMVSLISVIFSKVLPGVRATNIQLAFGVFVIVFANALIGHWLAGRKKHWSSMVREFLGMSLVNFGLVIVYARLLPNVGREVNLGNTLFFALLLTLLVTLYDHYRKIYDARFG